MEDNVKKAAKNLLAVLDEGVPEWRPEPDQKDEVSEAWRELINAVEGEGE